MNNKVEKNSHSGSRSRALWWWVTLAFVILISAWAFLIVTAVRNQPDVLEVESP